MSHCKYLDVDGVALLVGQLLALGVGDGLALLADLGLAWRRVLDLMDRIEQISCFSLPQSIIFKTRPGLQYVVPRITCWWSSVLWSPLRNPRSWWAHWAGRSSWAPWTRPGRALAGTLSTSQARSLRFQPKPEKILGLAFTNQRRQTPHFDFRVTYIAPCGLHVSNL